jgi:hypothetical protein
MGYRLWVIGKGHAWLQICMKNVRAAKLPAVETAKLPERTDSGLSITGYEKNPSFALTHYL